MIRSTCRYKISREVDSFHVQNYILGVTLCQDWANIVIDGRVILCNHQIHLLPLSLIHYY